MAKRPLKVYKKTQDGMVQVQGTRVDSSGQSPTAELVLSADGNIDKRGITQRVMELPDVQRTRADAAGTSRFEELFHSIYDAVIIADAAGTVVQVNARAELNFMQDGEALTKRNVVELICGADTVLLREWQKAVASDQYLMLEAVCQRADESQFTSEIVVNAMRGWGEGALGFFIRDISTRKDAEAGLQEMNEKIVEAEKVQARMQTMSTLYYELNGPLQILVTLAELDQNEAYKEQLDRVVNILSALRKEEGLETVATDDGSRYRMPDEPPEPTDRMRALVIEKDAMLRDLFARALRSHFSGVEVDVADGSVAALDHFRQSHHGLIVMDVSRKESNGVEVVAQVREVCEASNWETPPFVLCAGFDVADWIEDLMASDPRYICLSKPVAVQELVAAATSHIGNA